MSVKSTLNNIYGPISEKYCLYFYILSVSGFVALLFVLIMTVYSGLTKKQPFSFYLHMIMLSILYVMAYLQNRLLYNMCVGKIKKESFSEGVYDMDGNTVPGPENFKIQY
jgi:hypothetical protein